MKKYLISGMAVLAMCAAFTSCSKDKEFELITPEKQSELNYENAFKSKYGDIDPTHSWGFADFRYKAGARTRAKVDPNGNMWEDAPDVGNTERTDVYNYVNTLGARAKSIPSDISTYYVTHIYTGTKTYGNFTPKNMDQLEFAESAPASITWDGKQEGDWFHILDFNAAVNNDWEGNMLVLETPPLNFAYHNSADSKWHDKWIGVDGSEIGPAYKDYYYICFDFEAMPNNIYTIFEMPDENGAKVNVAGYWEVGTTGQTLIDAGISSVTEPATEYTEEATYTVKSNWKAVQVFEGDKYIKGDDNYTDWIIRLVKAKEYEEEFPDADVRVLAEDLEITQTFDGQKYEGDFDFNDAVFDVIYNYQDATWIIVQAAGGTYPLYVEGVEVHEALGGATNQMINTNGTKNPSKPIKLNAKYTDANNIPVKVILPDGEKILTAGIGKAPHKIAVIPTFDWMGERVSIETVHPNFQGWVKDSNARWY